MSSTASAARAVYAGFGVFVAALAVVAGGLAFGIGQLVDAGVPTLSLRVDDGSSPDREVKLAALTCSIGPSGDIQVHNTPDPRHPATIVAEIEKAAGRHSVNVSTGDSVFVSVGAFAIDGETIRFSGLRGFLGDNATQTATRATLSGTLHCPPADS